VVIQITIGKVTVKPHIVGKIATVLQMGVVLWILIEVEYAMAHGMDFGCGDFAPAGQGFCMFGMAYVS